MVKHFSRIISALLTIFFLCWQSAYAAQIDQVLVFGDSLSDNGNIYSLTKKFHKVISSVPIIPQNPPYYEGRFTNGPVWIDDLAGALNVPLYDYAYGGAWAEPLHDSRLVIPFGIGMQVNYYLVSAVTDFHKDQHLFVIWAGANDYVTGRDDIDYATTNTVNSIESQIDWLTYYGAKNILVMNLPNLSVVPEVVKMGPNSVQQLKDLVGMHNDKLQKMLAAQQAKHPDAKIIYGNVTDYFDDVYYHPEKYNITDVKNPCYDGAYYLHTALADKEIAAAKEKNIDIMRSPSLLTAYKVNKLAEGGMDVCENQDQHLFWDQIHPTRILHHLMALNAMTILGKNDIQGQSSLKS